MRFLLTTALSTILAGQLFAGDVALVISNEDYNNGPDISSASVMFDAKRTLKAKGFSVSTLENGRASDLSRTLGAFAPKADGTGRIVIVAVGHFAKSQTGSWLLGVDADTPSFGTAIGVDVETLIEVAARAPGQAVVLLGTEGSGFDMGAGLRNGIFLDTIPQGVTVITGPADDIADFTGQDLLVAGQSIVGALEGWPTLTSAGFLAPLVPFMGTETAVTVPKIDPNSAERAFWKATQSIGTVNGFRGYLSRYKNGLFANDARTAITRIELEPALQAENAEAALNLQRDARREIQRALSLIGFDPKGIDGIFGPGSRAAIGAFQKSIGENGTGFLTRSQIERLSIQAEIRALELEREAKIRKAELEQKDRAYWDATGALGDEAGLRAYLERYPDGVFAEIATVRLEPFEAQRRAQAAVEDRAAWDVAESQQTATGFQEYLAIHPNGAFTQQARERVVALQQTQQNSEALAAAQRNEDRLGLNSASRRLVEDRLEKGDLKPGVVDGEFDENTRRAIRRFQEARNLPKTGFLNQATMVRLLAEAVFR